MPQARFDPVFTPCMSVFTKVERRGPSQLFGMLTGSNSDFKIIVDNTGIFELDFAYLVDCCHSVLIYRRGQQVFIELYHLTRFCRQLRYKQHLLGIVD